MIRFESDYSEGCIPEILTALAKTNTEQTPGYGVDKHCNNARKLIQKACHNTNVDVHFLVGGTQANATVIASILKSYQGVICADTGHIHVHETGAVEATGHKCLPIPTKDGKITAKEVEDVILAQKNDASHEHIVQPGMIYISFPTETGTLYTKKELQALYKVAKKYNKPLFVDGARMGYGLMSKRNNLELADFAKYSDVFYIGGTKVGALFGEAVVIVNPALKKDFRYSIKQRGGMLAKGRLLGIQFEELFKENRYFTISKQTMRLAEKLTAAFQKKGYTFYYKPETNQLFPILTNAKAKQLRKHFTFLDFGTVDKNHTICRFVLSFLTTEESVDALIKAL